MAGPAAPAPGLQAGLAKQHGTRLHGQTRAACAAATVVCRADGRRLQHGADAALASPEAAAAAGVVLAASQELQDAAVGLYDSRLSRFAISDSQVTCRRHRRRRQKP